MEYHIDAKNKVLGRLATDIALILQGKKSAAYQRNRVSDDKVYVKNVEGLRVTGNKLIQKTYYKHTGYVGHLKEKSLEQKMEQDPKWVLQRAVRKMLPRNFLTQQRIKNLVFLDKAGAVVRVGMMKKTAKSAATE
jgi:large subunit ribosomal protein L13